MEHRQILTGIALTLATTFAWAQSPGPAPTNAPPPDPLAGYIKPAEWLKKQEKPKFKEGHTLPPLTRCGWELGTDAKIEFAEHWGYCLEVGGYMNPGVVDRLLNDPKDPNGQLLTLAAKDPKKYKVAVITSREMPPYDKAPPETFARDAQGHLLSGQAKSQDGTTWAQGMEAVLSPTAPDSFWKESGRLQAAPLKRLNERCPIAVVLNMGEYGLHIAGWGQKVWEKDPAIVKAKGDKSWNQWAGERVGRSQKLIADEIRRALPNAEYIYYCAGGSGIRSQYGWWDAWSPHYEHMRGICTVPTGQLYYKDFNDGWLGGNDLPTMFLNARGQEIAGGEPFQYPWLCAGFKQLTVGPDVSDIPRYMGFLRFAYTAGMIGGNAGYYNYPDFGGPDQSAPTYVRGRRGFDAKFPPNEPPNWLEQMVALARVHAQFSYLEHYLRQGDLLPGPYSHSWSLDQPAYELLPAELAESVEIRYPMKVEQQDDTGWEKAEFNDAAWKRIDLPHTAPRVLTGVAGWREGDPGEGVVWYRKTVDIPAALAGKALVLKLAPCDDSDITYWNGEKVGEMFGLDKPREYRIPSDKVKAGRAVIAVRVKDFRTTGGGGIGDWRGPQPPETLSLVGADGSSPILLGGPWKHAIAREVLADKSRKPEYARLLPGRPVRVVARKLKDKPQWLITAWAADGKEREVHVPVPELGEVAIKATAEANVYEATLKAGKPVVKLLVGG